MWTRWGEIPKLRSKAVSKHFAAIFPHFTDVYLQAPVFFTLTSRGPLLLRPNRYFGVALHPGQAPLQISLVSTVHLVYDMFISYL